MLQHEREASARVFSHNSVSNEMSPPTRVCSFAPSVPNTDRDLTVIPRTTPRLFTTCRFGSSVAVVVAF
jgi:hypothetical protein